MTSNHSATEAETPTTFIQRILQRSIDALARLGLVASPINVPAVNDDPRHGWTHITNSLYNQPGWGPTTYNDLQSASLLDPYVKSVIYNMTNYLLAQNFSPTAPGLIGKFIERFWNHEQNRTSTRLIGMLDELSRSGDLFVVLFRNPIDGMSYIRTIPKGDIIDIIRAPNDWETELEYHQRNPDDHEKPIIWYGHRNPKSAETDAIVLHYAINRLPGQKYGNSDVQGAIKWSRNYITMLEDRVRLNAAARAFVWDVTVPTHEVDNKIAQYGAVPEPGSLIIHDDNETWNAVAPKLNAADASKDLEALRMMLATATLQPKYWNGDGGDINRATAKVMEGPAMHQLQRRQKELEEFIRLLCHVAYSRAYEIGQARAIPDINAIQVDLPDLTRDDPNIRSQTARNISTVWTQLAIAIQGTPSKNMRREMIRTIYQALDRSITEDELDEIIDELDVLPIPTGGNNNETGTGKASEPGDRDGDGFSAVTDDQLAELFGRHSDERH